jgi:hypothetical protein
MKANKILLLSILSLSLLTACQDTNNGGGNNDKPKGEEITVYFYADYNQKPIGNVYYQCKVYNGELIKDVPSDPSEPLYPDFPNFKGWSVKELIASDEDLWDFSTDIVDIKSNSLDLFGFWAAEGE